MSRATAWMAGLPSTAGAIVLVAAPILLLPGCGDPVADAEIDALPPDVPGVDQGEFHRPGQPCTLCHSDYYGAGQTFSVAGTLFAIPAQNKKSKPRPVNGATVSITDTTGETVHTKTNCVGNFFFTADQYNPQYPLHVVVEADVPTTPPSQIRQVMFTRVNRDGSCASCHFNQQSEVSPGWVWAYQDPTDPTADPFPKPDDTCPGAANFQ